MLAVSNDTKVSFKVKHGKETIEIIFRPLTQREKGEIAQYTITNGGEVAVNRTKALTLILKKTILEVKGFTDLDGKEWNVEKDEEGNLTEESVDVLMNCPVYQPISSMGWSLSNQVPSALYDPLTGEEMKHVKIKFLRESKIKK